MPVLARYALYVVVTLAALAALTWLAWQAVLLLAWALAQYLLLVVLVAIGPEALPALGPLLP